MIQSTALVHEAYLRLVDVEKAQHWNSRGHFFAAAAEAMRRILLNRARDKGRIKRGGGFRREEALLFCHGEPAIGNKFVADSDCFRDTVEALSESTERAV